MGMTWDAFTLEPACHIIFLSVELRAQLSSLQLAYVRDYFHWQLMYCTRLSPLQIAYISIHGFPLRNSCVIHGLPISIVAYILIRHQKYKTWLMDTSWALIINYPNYFNLLNLRNHSISQSINRGLGVGINQSSLESRVMLVVYLQKSWRSRT